MGGVPHMSFCEYEYLNLYPTALSFFLVLLKDEEVGELLSVK